VKVAVAHYCDHLEALQTTGDIPLMRCGGTCRLPRKKWPGTSRWLQHGGMTTTAARWALWPSVLTLNFPWECQGKKLNQCPWYEASAVWPPPPSTSPPDDGRKSSQSWISTTRNGSSYAMCKRITRTWTTWARPPSNCGMNSRPRPQPSPSTLALNPRPQPSPSTVNRQPSTLDPHWDGTPGPLQGCRRRLHPIVRAHGGAHPQIPA